jgi:hypothetical protein
MRQLGIEVLTDRERKKTESFHMISWFKITFLQSFHKLLNSVLVLSPGEKIYLTV